METANTSYQDRVRQALESELEAWDEIERRSDFRTIVILVPDCYQVIPERREGQARYYGMDPSKLDALLPNRIVTEALKKRGMRFIDPTKAFARMDDVARLYYVNDNHFTAEGHRRFAQIIHDELNAALSDLRISALLGQPNLD